MRSWGVFIRQVWLRWSLFGLMVPHNSRGSFSWRQVGCGWLAKATDWKSDWIIHPWKNVHKFIKIPWYPMHKSMDPNLTPQENHPLDVYIFYQSNHPKTTITINPPPPGVSPPKQKKKGCGKVSKFPVRSWAMVVMSTALLVQYPWQMRMPVRRQPRPCPRRGVRESGVRPRLGVEDTKNGWVCLEVSPKKQKEEILVDLFDEWKNFHPIWGRVATPK